MPANRFTQSTTPTCPKCENDDPTKQYGGQSPDPRVLRCKCNALFRYDAPGVYVLCDKAGTALGAGPDAGEAAREAA